MCGFLSGNHAKIKKKKKKREGELTTDQLCKNKAGNVIKLGHGSAVLCRAVSISADLVCFILRSKALRKRA